MSEKTSVATIALVLALTAGGAVAATSVEKAVALRQAPAILRRELILRVGRGEELQLRSILELDVLVPDPVVMRPARFQGEAHGARPARGCGSQVRK